MNTKIVAGLSLAVLLAPISILAEVVVTEANNGNLVMENIPAVPQSVVSDLNRYQNVRSASFQAWAEEGEGIFVTTRFGDVSQIHHVGSPGGARTQITFFDEPVGGVTRQPQGSKMVFTMDVGGSEFSQIFLLDPQGSDDSVMLTDGESRNDGAVWDRTGDRIAYRSTRRNGASNDVWMMDVNNPDAAGMVLESPDGTWWGAADFSADSQKLMIVNYVGNADSRIHLLDIESGELTLLAGDPDNPSSNFAFAFDADGTGFYYVTDANGEFLQLAWKSLEADAEPVYITAEIPWHVGSGAISKDRSRGAFVVNQHGHFQLYLIECHHQSRFRHLRIILLRM